jgi:hypothetical protein
MMRAGVIALGLAALLGACSTREVKPTSGELNVVEAALDGQPCIGDIKTWQRHYFYHAKYFGEEVKDAAKEARVPRSSGHIRTLITFDLRQGGANVAGRQSLAAPLVAVNDQPEMGARRALGSYDMRNGAVKIESCDLQRR